MTFKVFQTFPKLSLTLKTRILKCFKYLTPSLRQDPKREDAQSILYARFISLVLCQIRDLNGESKSHRYSRATFFSPKFFQPALLIFSWHSTIKCAKLKLSISLKICYPKKVKTTKNLLKFEDLKQVFAFFLSFFREFSSLSPASFFSNRRENFHFVKEKNPSDLI